jgi:hypothetical protein
MEALVAQLKSLPPDSPITSGQLAALLEAVLAHTQTRTLSSSPHFDSLPSEHELTQVEVSQWLRKATSTLEKLRVSGKGPAYKPGKPVLYKVGDIKAWLASRRVNSTSEATVKGIHRLETVADLFPVFTFENKLPMGLETALDYQELNPEAVVQEVLFINPESVLQMAKATPALEGLKAVIDTELVIYQLMKSIEAFEEGSDTPYENVLSLAEKFVAAGVAPEDIASDKGDGLPHLLAGNAESIIMVLDSEGCDSSAVEGKTIEALSKLESMGFDLEAKSEDGKTPAQVAFDNSNIRAWLLAKKQRETLQAEVDKKPSQTTSRGEFKL